MLVELNIRDFAIIDKLSLNLDPGFVALTGETGAGKSIIIDAVELVLGGRADREVVRSGAEMAQVEAVFRPDPTHLAAIQPTLEREGLEGDDSDILVLSREVRAEGRSICRVNGRAVTLALLREVAEGLVDIHGQSEHLSLYRVREHLDLLDRYGNLWDSRSQVADVVSQVRSVRQERKGLERDEEELARRMDLLTFQIQEITAAALTPGEEQELGEERVRLANAEKLANLLNEGLMVLDEGSEEEPGAVDLIGTAVRTLEALARIDESLEERRQEAEDVNYRLQDLVSSLRDYQKQLEFSPKRLADVEERLELIRRLERKYGPTIPEVLEYALEAQREVDSITHSEERIIELRVEEDKLLAELGRMASDLSRRRKETAEALSRSIEMELQDLRMEGAQFGVGFERKNDPEGVPIHSAMEGGMHDIPQEPEAEPQLADFEGSVRVAFDSSGIDQVEFLVSPNPGEPLKPMAKVASGGETSRLMLALKTVLSRADRTPTLIFDEIDQGIGGRVGATVGEKLWELTKAHGEGLIPHQVLCVTHLPQLAGFGDAHLKVGKQVIGDRTVTRVTQLQGQTRAEELAQMLGGAGESALRSAQEILAQVKETKRVSTG
jgi:DNA repair protein RecN (Recombination protein N)